MPTSPFARAVPAARGIRIMHVAVLIGLILAAAVLLYLSRTIRPALAGSPIIAYVTAAFGFVNLLVATAFLLPRIPQRSAGEAPDDYWSRSEIRTAAIIVWALLEGSGLIALVGYYLTGGVAPVAVAGLAIGALILARPARIEGDGAGA